MELEEIILTDTVLKNPIIVDILGVPLEIGDTIVFSYERGSSLHTGQVQGFTRAGKVKVASPRDIKVLFKTTGADHVVKTFKQNI